MDFNALLQSKLDDKLFFINDNVRGILSDTISEFRKSLETVITALKHANILTEDRYQSSRETYELKLPPDEEVEPESRTFEISYRLSEYLRQIEFLENNYNISPDELTIDRCMELIDFFNFINWERGSPASSSANERMLAEIEQKALQEDEKLIGGIVRDGKKQLAGSSRKILNGLEDIKIYLRENYKLEIRNRVLPSISIVPEAAARKPDEAVLIIKKGFRDEMGGIPFLRSLAAEIIDEDYSSNLEAVRAETILRIDDNLSSDSNEIMDFDFEQTEADPELLLEGFRLLSAAGPSLLQVSEKLLHNSDIIENTRLSLFQRLFLFLSGRKSKGPERIYSVIIFSAKDETGSKLKIDLNRFTAELIKEGRLLMSLAQKSNADALELEKHLKRVFRFQTILPAVDQYMKEKANNAMRGSMNGIKLDQNNIQSCLIKANKRRLEYQAQQQLGF